MVLPNYAARRRGGRKQCAAKVVLFIIAENPKNCKSNFVLTAVKRSTKTDTEGQNPPRSPQRGRRGLKRRGRPSPLYIGCDALPGPLILTKSAAP